MGKLIVKQRRSLIGRPPEQRATVRGLGLKRIGHQVEIPDTPASRGMVLTVQHIVDVVAEEGEPKLTGARHRNRIKAG